MKVLKHKLKNLVREVYARLLFHTGLHALVDRLMPRRLTILCGHCVEPRRGFEGSAHLPADMKASRSLAPASSPDGASANTSHVAGVSPQ